MPERGNVRPSVCPSRYLLLNHWVEFYQTCCFTSPNGKGVREQHYFSVHPSVCLSSVHLSVTLSPLKPLDGIQSKLLPLMVRLCKSNINFHASIHLCVRHPSIYPSRYLFLTNGWNSTNLATLLSLLVSVCESNIIFLCVNRPSICPSRYLLLNHCTEFNQTYYITSPHGYSVREHHYFSVRRLSICPSGYLLNYWAEFNQTYYMTSLMVRVWESKSVRHAFSDISKERGDLRWRAIDCAF